MSESVVRALILKSEFDRIQFELSLTNLEDKELMSADAFDEYKVIRRAFRTYVLFGWDEAIWEPDEDPTVKWLFDRIYEAICKEREFSCFVRIGEDLDDNEHIGSDRIVRIDRDIYHCEVDYELLRDVCKERRLNK